MCGVGFICHIKGHASHKIVSDARSILCNMTHRGASELIFVACGDEGGGLADELSIKIVGCMYGARCDMGTNVALNVAHQAAHQANE